MLVRNKNAIRQRKGHLGPKAPKSIEQMNRKYMCLLHLQSTLKTRVAQFVLSRQQQKHDNNPEQTDKNGQTKTDRQKR